MLGPRLHISAIALLAAIASSTHAGTTVYSNDFENPDKVGKEWSATNVETTPRNGRHFLGNFTTDKLTFKLDDLPKHEFVRITLELYIMNTWDGNAVFSTRGSRIGPDAWKMELDGGLELVNATFSNLDFNSPNIVKEAQTQSYPSLLPGESHPARTGATENNTLGFDWPLNNLGPQPVDSVYKMTFTLPHTAGSVQFNFAGAEGLQPADDECWGLDNVKVEVLDAADLKPPDVAATRLLWDAIGGPNPAAETEAFWKLVEGGDKVADFLRNNVKKSDVDKKKFSGLMLALDGDDFEAREKATEDVANLGPAAEALIRDALRRSESLEVKTRLSAALRKLHSTAPVDPEMRRRAIALKLLRIIGTKEAEKVALELSGK